MTESDTAIFQQILAQIQIIVQKVGELDDLRREVAALRVELSRVVAASETKAMQCEDHRDRVTALENRMGGLEREVSTMQGGWKVYLGIGGLSGIAGAIVSRFFEK